MPPDPWSDLLDDLEDWHAQSDRASATRALKFLEVELRLRFPPAARRRWPQEQLDDALQGFLTRLLQRPLPTAARSKPAPYLIRSFKNWCIDVERGRKRSAAEPWEDDAPAESTSDDHEARERLAQLSKAVDKLGIEDRVALKMADAPAMLTWEELGWLAKRSGLAEEEVRDRVLACPPVFELTMIFDPGPEPKTTKGRRDRMERFRKRRARARQRLRELMGGTP